MYNYKAKLVRVIDGDTLDAMIDLGFKTWVKKRIRLSGINAPEIRTRNKEEKKKGFFAKARLTDVLNSNGNEFLLISHGVGKYGRCLGEIHVSKNYIRSKKYHGKSVNEMLVKEGHATKYEC
jgi:micrococcal nuclease